MKKIKWLVAFLIVANLLLGVIGCKDPEIHVHTFAEAWTADENGHWHAAICEHTDEISGFAEHSYGEYVSNNDATTEADGTKTRECSVCGYEDTVTDEGSKIENGSTTPEGFVLIPAGSFQMGSEEGDSNEQPVHEVTITKPFYMGKYEVTQAEYEEYCSYGSNSPSSSYGDGDNYPAYYVSWYDALVYCNKRSMAEGLTPCYSINDSTNPEEWGELPTASWDDPLRDTWDAATCNWNANGYRLPTDAEWEYAARAGDNTVDSLTYSGTSDVNKLGDYAWYYDSANDNTHEVGTKEANAYGLYDMSGNVWEWCWNWYTDSYDTTTEGGSDPTGSSAGSYRVGRGGGWGSHSGSCAVSCRDYNYPSLRGINLGFRVVRSSTDEDPEIHVHTYSEAWTNDASGHWHAATCEHTDEISGFAEHSYGEYVSNNDATTEADGTKTRECSVCGYEDTVTDEGSKLENTSAIPEGFVLVAGKTITGEESWIPSSSVFVSERKLTIPDLIVSDHEVTRGEYKAVMGSDPSTASANDKDGNELEGDDVLNNPVNYVSWYDALVYCNKLSIMGNLTPCYSINGSTNPEDWGTVPTSSNTTWNAATCDFEANGYRLPTEAEWEWLARGGENYTYAGSDYVDDVAWYTSNTNDTGTREVKTKAPNGYGLYDMSGNVWEWCWDWYGSISSSSVADGATSGNNRVNRGGSWYFYDFCQVAYRNYYNPNYRCSSYGFRVVRASSN